MAHDIAPRLRAPSDPCPRISPAPPPSSVSPAPSSSGCNFSQYILNLASRVEGDSRFTAIGQQHNQTFAFEYADEQGPTTGTANSKPYYAPPTIRMAFYSYGSRSQTYCPCDWRRDASRVSPKSGVLCLSATHGGRSGRTIRLTSSSTSTIEIIMPPSVSYTPLGSNQRTATCLPIADSSPCSD